MIEYRTFRAPGSDFTTSVSTSVCYVGLYEDGKPIGQLWAKQRTAQGDIALKVAAIVVAWPLNKRLEALPQELEGMPKHVIEYEGYFGRNTITLADGRRFHLPLCSGGYLDNSRGELVTARQEYH